jgi:integrase
MTGMRRSELLGLRWSDVNLTLAELSINRTMHRLQNHEVIYRMPKTEKSRRVVALSPATCKVLRDLWESQVEIRARFNSSLKNSDLGIQRNEWTTVYPPYNLASMAARSKAIRHERYSLP